MQKNTFGVETDDALLYLENDEVEWYDNRDSGFIWRAL